ncbi:MAG: aspartate-semialdehyde dehydrogenase [Bacteroidales bacterium]
MKIAVVGATGLVGSVMLKVLEEQHFPVGMLIAVASEKSAGRKISFQGKEFTVYTNEQAVSLKPDVALFSAGAETSKIWAPRYAATGTTVIDNSSAWRQVTGIPLIVPEVNAHILKRDDKIIANPNCSTIQLVVVLHPLHQAYGLKRVVVSTYQSVTGSGIRGVRQLQQERNQEEAEQFYSHPIDLNVIPQGGTFSTGGYTTEEIKLVSESRKILGIPQLALTGTVVRVPVYGGHSESVNIEFEKAFQLEDVFALLKKSPGIVVTDSPERQEYPMPLMAQGRDEVFVGRIRRDESISSGINLWIVSDNLRKGAATNAVQIAQYLFERKLL